MKCPSCFNKLVETKTGQVFVDLCTLCKGIWFDSGEFLDVVRSLFAEKTIEDKPPALEAKGAPVAAKSAADKEKFCPRCDNRLSKYNYAYDSNVILDRCPKCQGIWADGGEVRQILAFLRRIRGTP